MQAEHTVHIGGPPHATHASNKIKTSLYTILNFVPLNLFKQFHRVANVWFFLICCLQTIKSISVTDGKPSAARAGWVAGRCAVVAVVTVIDRRVE